VSAGTPADSDHAAQIARVKSGLRLIQTPRHPDFPRLSRSELFVADTGFGAMHLVAHDAATIASMLGTFRPVVFAEETSNRIPEPNGSMLYFRVVAGLLLQASAQGFASDLLPYG